MLLRGIVAVVLVACSNSGAPGDGGAIDGASDAGACLTPSTPCTKSSVCVEENCGGNCCGAAACVGQGDASTCTAPNVDYSATCAPSCTGGDPSGTWTLAGACIAPECATDASANGVVGPVATLVVGGTGGPQLNLNESLHCGSGAGVRFIGGSEGIGGMWDPDAGTVGGKKYCVQGSTLYLFYPANDSSGLAALELTR